MGKKRSSLPGVAPFVAARLGAIASGRCGRAVLACLFAITLPRAAALAGAQESSPAERRGQAFWLALARSCKVPAGETAFGLVGEALTVLGSTDSVWRDDIGYGVVASCVYQARALKPDERRALVAQLTPNLRRGIGETAGASVLRRSYSALDLSIFAALELEDPALDDAGYRALLDAAFAYLWDERDLRGLEPGTGWIHATAHTADLLKFLARDRRFTAADQKRLFEAAWAKMTAEGTPVFTHAEEERLAAALAATVRRPDFELALLESWLSRFPELEKRVWAQSPPAAQLLDAAQNAHSLLRCLFVALSLPTPSRPGAAPPPAPAAEAARLKVLATLEAVRRS